MKSPIKSKIAKRHFGPRLTAKSFFWHRRLIGKSPAGDMSSGGGGMGKPGAPGDQSPMAATFLERIWAWLHRTFPERQIYIRSDGRVQFFTFGPSLQATLAGMTLIFLGCMAFATINVIFKDRIITAKDHRFQQMQSAYENRLADLQISYDELNGALVGAEDKFKTTADEIQTKQNVIVTFLKRKAQVETQVAGHAPMTATAMNMTMDTGAASDSIGAATPPGITNTAADEGEDIGGSSLTVLPGPALPQPRTGKPIAAASTKTGMMGGMFQRIQNFAAGIFVKAAPAPLHVSAATAQHPALRALAAQTARLQDLDKSESALMAETGTALDGEVGALKTLVRRTGLNPDQLGRKGQQAMGGPEIPLEQVQVAGLTDPGFNSAYLKASATLQELNVLSSQVDHIPLNLPVSGAGFDRSSGFGSRLDPFTHRYAFHSGLDFAGPWGAPVRATAAGTVIFIGNRSGYGNMVEIDHGMGLHTRYGHLSAITARVGTLVGKGMNIGRVGSTGRSTGAHVHYEVWYDNIVRNPSKFIEAGRHVF